MSSKHYHKKPHPNAPIWWLFALILIAGGTGMYFLAQEWRDVTSRIWFSRVLLVTIIGSGICLIAITRGLWLKR